MKRIRAGKVEEVVPESGNWIFIDPGFASKAASCGFLDGQGSPRSVTFAKLQAVTVAAMQSSRAPVNLVIEAPLSVAFQASGNPVGRAFERQGSQTRYWYVGLGCAVMTSAMYLMRTITEATDAEVRLFEGFVSFKPKGQASSHTEDVLALRSIVWGSNRAGRVIPPDEFRQNSKDNVMSAFDVAGMMYGIPPVLAVGA
ncbi:MAG: hypothetical protein U5R46_19850 [Gammaproteobacteria bacterium]|nr:hypothetical protein [Gammaproteobacteria bacterium]